MNSDIQLINFKIPRPMKKQFQEICQSRNVTVTSVINYWIADYIRDNQVLIDPDHYHLPLGFNSNE